MLPLCMEIDAHGLNTLAIADRKRPSHPLRCYEPQSDDEEPLSIYEATSRFL